ncbi:hypothetical protein J7E52_21045 [Bacillus sp. ISL-34]|uniref:hypothetical protein n=1 Tax=Bacillus sp. ISL-34 TaxID=2819121 RepID=UPI001BE940E1|nr:hypothetical protein [Bacillus sp. ISL-34]MBT2649161.1 hypothetical protein [Bacillus sp. ISL-34]
MINGAIATSKTFCTLSLNRLPMRAFCSTCQRGKIIPLWGTNSLCKANENMKEKPTREKPKGQQIKK